MEIRSNLASTPRVNIMRRSLLKAGDILLLYCTESYAAYPKQVPGIGVTIRADSDRIEYRWMPFIKPLGRELIEQAFELEDHKKMKELRFNTRRAFEISKRSFVKTVAEHPLLWKEA
jgi:hypothetical protein